MIIHEPKISKGNEYIAISSYIQLEGERKNRSGKLWFRVPEEYEPFITKSSNSFIVGAILLAMQLEEDITVKGHMSPKLSYGLNLFQEYFNYWYPKKFKIIKFKCDNYVIENNKNNKKIGCTFSGGVDSFYTLYTHLPGRIAPKDAVTHCLFLSGLDKWTKDDREIYDILRDRYRKLISKMGLDILPMITNGRHFLEERGIGGIQSFGVVIASSILMVPIFHRFHIASSQKYTDLLPHGSNIYTDHYLSIENLDFICHGADKSRLQKTYIISEWPETYDNLRVCSPRLNSEKDNVIVNCCRCDKCTRTMLTLYLKGALDKYKKSFKEPLDIRNWRFSVPSQFSFAKEIIEEAMALKLDKVVEDIKFVIKKSGFDLDLNEGPVEIAKNFTKFFEDKELTW